MNRLLTVLILAMATFTFLGNAIKSVITSTVFVSEGAFASFLSISVEKTQVIVELLIGSAVMALALAPFILNARTAHKLTLITGTLATLSFAALGLSIDNAPTLFLREIAVIGTFSIAGFCAAFFAPIAQMAINGEPDEKRRMVLSTVWTSAQPIAFLITPQLVKYVALNIGTGNYFLIMSATPVLFMVLARFALRTEDLTITKPVLAPASVGWILAGVAAFEAWTVSNSFAGLASPISLSLFAVFVVIAFLAYSNLRRAKIEGGGLPVTAMLLLIALFILEIPTTGFYDTAYLVRHLCSNTLIEDRASLGAAAQILAVFLAGFALARWPKSLLPQIWVGLLFILAGTVGFYFYPEMEVDAQFFYVTKMIAGFGMGIVTAVIVSMVMATGRSSPAIALLPAVVIMFGTEVGLELMEVVYLGAKLIGFEEVGAYRLVFIGQIIATVAACLPVIEVAIHRQKERPAIAAAS